MDRPYFKILSHELQDIKLAWSPKTRSLKHLNFKADVILHTISFINYITYNAYNRLLTEVLNSWLGVDLHEQGVEEVASGAPDVRRDPAVQVHCHVCHQQINCFFFSHVLSLKKPFCVKRCYIPKAPNQYMFIVWMEPKYFFLLWNL